MLKTKVIAKNVTNLTDARYFAAQGVDYIMFDTSSITLEQMIDIQNWIEGVGILLILNDQDQDELFELIDKLQPVAVGSKSSELLSLILLHFPDQQIFSYAEQRNFLHESAFIIASLPIYDNRHPVTTHPSAINNIPLFVDTSDLEPDHVKSFLDKNPDLGIVLNGSNEEKVGVKEFDSLDEYFDILEE